MVCTIDGIKEMEKLFWSTVKIYSKIRLDFVGESRGTT